MTVPPSTHGNHLSSNHWVHIQDSAGHEVFVLSGTVILDPPLVGTSATRWNRGSTAFDIPLYGLPDGQGLVIEQWAPTVLLGSIQNDGVSNNAGWAVDDFNVYVPSEPVSAVEAQFTYAVGDGDGYLMRVSYSVTVVGHYAPVPVIQ